MLLLLLFLLPSSRPSLSLLFIRNTQRCTFLNSLQTPATEHNDLKLAIWLFLQTRLMRTELAKIIYNVHI